VKAFGDEVVRLLERAGPDAYAHVRYWTGDVTRHPGGGREAFHARLVDQDGAPSGTGWGATPHEAFLAALADAIEQRGTA
jgi:hypothetical protein